jgi:hypothetical protein
LQACLRVLRMQVRGGAGEVEQLAAVSLRLLAADRTQRWLFEYPRVLQLADNRVEWKLASPMTAPLELVRKLLEIRDALGQQIHECLLRRCRFLRHVLGRRATVGEIDVAVGRAERLQRRPQAEPEAARRVDPGAGLGRSHQPPFWSDLAGTISRLPFVMRSMTHLLLSPCAPRRAMYRALVSRS